MAIPRFTCPQQTLVRSGSLCRYSQKGRPVRTSNAKASLGGCVTYMTPLTTSGVVSTFSRLLNWNAQSRRRRWTLAVLTWSRPL